jgi:LmbE family N-acetylglucosaminyl deacetylase
MRIDLTEKRVLTFFAHPDDETLAAGATIARMTSVGSAVYVAIPATGMLRLAECVHSRLNTQGELDRDADLAELRRDCEKALSVLGVPRKNIFLGSFPDNELDSHSLLELIHWLEKIIAEVKPDVILTHHRRCTNIDHQYCHEAVVVATRPGLNDHVTVLCGEVPSSTGYLRPTEWEPNLYVQAGLADIERKIIAMETYKGEALEDPHPRSRAVLKALAKVRGSESGFYFAEAFMIQKAFA